MTQIQQSIILVSIIGTVLSEYEENELTPAIRDIKFVCQRFMDSQSGVKVIPLIGPKIVDRAKYKQFRSSVAIGDKLWKEALDKYAKEKITIDAISMIVSVYNFNPAILAKHAHISKNRIESYAAEGKDSKNEYKVTGCVVGGYLNEILAREMGKKINGRLQALKRKVEKDLNENV